MRHWINGTKDMKIHIHRVRMGIIGITEIMETILWGMAPIRVFRLTSLAWPNGRYYKKCKGAGNEI